MKTVIYLGVEYSVPDWAKFIASDYDGNVFVYCSKPKIRTYVGSDSIAYTRAGVNDKVDYVGKIDSPNYPIEGIE